MEIKALPVVNLASLSAISTTLKPAAKGSAATDLKGAKGVASSILDSVSSDGDTPSEREKAIDDDALNYLTSRDMLKLMDLYKDAQIIGIDPQTIDSMAIALGAKRRDEEQKSGIPREHASKESIKLLRDAIHERVRESEKAYDANGRLHKKTSTFSLFG